MGSGWGSLWFGKSKLIKQAILVCTVSIMGKSCVGWTGPLLNFSRGHFQTLEPSNKLKLILVLLVGL